MLITRITISILVIFFAIAILQLYGWKLEKLATKSPSIADSMPTILFFSSEDCNVCHTAQRPALMDTQKSLRQELKIVEIDANTDHMMTKTWKILSVPTLVILDKQGQLVTIKYGLRSKQELLTILDPLYNNSGV